MTFDLSNRFEVSWNVTGRHLLIVVVVVVTHCQFVPNKLIETEDLNHSVVFKVN